MSGLWKRFSRTTRQVKSTIVIFAVFVGWFFGILNDVPQGLAKAKENGPAWVTWLIENPDFWWCAFMVGIGAIALVCIWARRDDGPLPRECLHIELLQQAINRALASAMHAAKDGPDALRSEIETQFDVGMGRFLEAQYGKPEREKYLRTLRKAKDDSDPLKSVRVALSYLLALTDASVLEIVQAANHDGKGPASSSPTSDEPDS